MFENCYKTINDFEIETNKKHQFQTDTDSNLITNEALEYLQSVKENVFKGEEKQEEYGQFEVEMSGDKCWSI